MKVFDVIPEDQIAWAKDQKIFWVASAPWGHNLSNGGHVNVSPKGYDSFEFVDNRTVWYADATGSGNETISHVNENGRITIMFIAFQGPPNILRFFGKGRVFERGSPQFERLLPPYDERRMAGIRAIIWVDIHRVQTSCGFSVPFMSFEGHRMQLIDYFAKREGVEQGCDAIASPTGDVTRMPPPEESQLKKTGLWAYWAEKNANSIDGLPGLRTLVPQRTGTKTGVPPRRADQSSKQLLIGIIIGVLVARIIPFATQLVSVNVVSERIM